MPHFTNTHSLDSATESLAQSSPLLGSMLSGAMLALGVALLLVILLRRSGRYYQKLKRRSRKADRPGAHKVTAKKSRREEQLANMFDRASPLLDAPSTVVRWQVEMQELARELKAEIDTKMCLLQVLVRRSNEAAERLEAAATRAERLGCVDRADSQIPDTESLAAHAANLATAPVPKLPPYSEQVYAMSDSGDNVADIANEVGLPVGDVEFVLSLRSQPGESA